MRDDVRDAVVETTDHFPTDPAGLPQAVRSELVELGDGDELDLRIAPVAKELAGSTVRMLAYNGSIPGPTLRVPQGSEVIVNVDNEGDLDATVHWHGLRLENRYDGTHETQAPIPVGGRFTYRVQCPDPGLYWYHPHIREDYGQELGLYGNIVVVPSDPDYWPAVNREVVLTLDDVLIEDGSVAAFSRSEPTHVAMGRFGNVLLVGGEPELALDAHRGEVVRLYLTNTANTRVFNVRLPGARMKRVGGDSGHYEREEFVDEVLLAPSERAIVDVLFDEPGHVTLEHRTPDRTYPLAGITVLDQAATPPLAGRFDELRTTADMAAERARISAHLDSPPDKTLAFVAEMDLGVPEGPVVYTCPMHPEVVRDDPGRCPECGMALLATAVPASYTCPMHPEVVSDEPGRCHKCGMKLLSSALIDPGTEPHAHGDHHDHDSDRHEPHGAAHEHDHPGEGHDHHSGAYEHVHHGDSHGHGAPGAIEWEDDMVEVNRMTTPGNMRWKLVDRTTGAENHAIDWEFGVGDQVKMRLVNEMDSDHPMHHPFHVHGAGRFLILSRDGVVEPNLVWKDTVLVLPGETVDILLSVDNPGVWMMHCHIAEHHEGGMMLNFNVKPASASA
jgi:FtsP/CotA-like multicopper oxidase with cupredoxin domain